MSLNILSLARRYLKLTQQAVEEYDKYLEKLSSCYSLSRGEAYCLLQDALCKLSSGGPFEHKSSPVCDYAKLIWAARMEAHIYYEKAITKIILEKSLTSRSKAEDMFKLYINKAKYSDVSKTKYPNVSFL